MNGIHNSTVYSGRVEVVTDGEWGTVCDDGWDTTDASVVCRQLGYPVVLAAYRSAQFGRGSGAIRFGDLQCSGEEESLAACRPWIRRIEQYTGYCSHYKDAGVACSSGKIHNTYNCMHGRTIDFTLTPHRTVLAYMHIYSHKLNFHSLVNFDCIDVTSIVKYNLIYNALYCSLTAIFYLCSFIIANDI